MLSPLNECKTEYNCVLPSVGGGLDGEACPGMPTRDGAHTFSGKDRKTPMFASCSWPSKSRIQLPAFLLACLVAFLWQFPKEEERLEASKLLGQGGSQAGSLPSLANTNG